MSTLYSSSLLKNKVVLVTGAGKGIGRACVQACVQAGAHVIAVARTEKDLKRLVEESSGAVDAWAMDATSEAFIHRINALKQLDVLVNNVGGNQPEPINDVETATLDRLLNLNVRSVFLSSQAAVKKFDECKQPGNIINITSQMGHIGSPNRTVYCMTKHAIEGLTKALAVECAKRNIRVNSVAPTFIETPLTAPMLEDSTFKEFVLSKIPMGRIGQPVDVANAVVYLASELSGLVTGTSLKVDGGWTAE
ncbi:SDR family NAD(P)-dependent oxidoreductase [Alteromonas oceanisediminis]|uniref:SDR family NAD(P)-dependent oxidoreductase n=1 Tax=Alteromonas oceanisediminis TaxID=2836180 RepID=UPI001BDB4DE5|nr:SDR family oxidoreductase [Alteromonas oceanisediminis]MBT0585596.1 SDR family oxidoreductase [Alteromonas oceanisediminis]